MAKSVDETPHVAIESIRCNEFRNGRDYATFRLKGTSDWLLIATIGGQGNLVFSDGSKKISTAGDIVLYQPGSYHDYSTNEALGWWHIRWAHFMPKPDWLGWLRWPEIANKTQYLSLTSSARESCFGALSRMVVSARLAGDSSGELAMNALEEALIHAYGGLCESPTSQVDTRVTRAMHYLAAHVAEPFSMESLAKYSGLSVSRLTHLFSDEIGQSPQQFAEGLKLEAAQRLLRQTTLPISHIASEVGYTDAFYFSRRYRKYYGCTPSGDRSDS